MSARGGARVVAAAALTAAASAGLRAATAGHRAWERSNYRGRVVNLSGGVACAGAALLAAATAPRGLRAPALLVAAAASVTGAADDFAPDPGGAKGLRGHLGALARGQVTTGALKLLGISAAGAGAGALMHRDRALQALASGALIAGCANLINLFDLRPGRALKVVGVAAAAACAGNPAGHLGASAAGIALGAAAGDLKEETMLGDVGANSLGALVGLTLAAHPRPSVRWGGLGVVAALTLASEKVSFTRTIERVPALSWLDRLGRR